MVKGNPSPSSTIILYASQETRSQHRHLSSSALTLTSPWVLSTQSQISHSHPLSPPRPQQAWSRLLSSRTEPPAAITGVPAFTHSLLQPTVHLQQEWASQKGHLVRSHPAENPSGAPHFLLIRPPGSTCPGPVFLFHKMVCPTLGSHYSGSS